MTNHRRKAAAAAFEEIDLEMEGPDNPMNVEHFDKFNMEQM